MSDKYLIGANTRDTAQSYVDYLHNATHDGGRVGVVVPDRRVVAGNNVAYSSDDYNGYFKIVIKEEVEELPEGETLPEGEEPKKHYYLYIVDGKTFDSDYKYTDDENDPSMYNVFWLPESSTYFSMKPYKNEIKLPEVYTSKSLYVILRMFINVYADTKIAYSDIIFSDTTPRASNMYKYLVLGRVSLDKNTKNYVIVQDWTNNTPSFNWDDLDPVYKGLFSMVMVAIPKETNSKPLRPVEGPSVDADITILDFHFCIIDWSVYRGSHAVSPPILDDPSNPDSVLNSNIRFRVNDYDTFYVKPFITQLRIPEVGGSPENTELIYCLKWEIKNVNGVPTTESSIIEIKDKKIPQTTDSVVYKVIGRVIWYPYTHSYRVVQEWQPNSDPTIQWYRTCKPLEQGY